MSRIIVAVAVVLVGAAGYFALQPATNPDPPFVVEPVTVDLGSVTLGSHTLTFRVTNPAERPRRIIGLAEG